MKNKTTKDHFEKYANLSKLLGVGANGSKYLGQSRQFWRANYLKDQNLNSVPLSFFDAHFINKTWLDENEVSHGLTLSDSVCLHKHVIIYQVLKCEPDFKEIKQ